jgi:hypothetical protein
MSAALIRFGHAFNGESALDDALRVVCGTEKLCARTPRDPAAVIETETALGYDPSNIAQRPVYAYLGDLHPALGTVGVVIERAWCRSLNGVSRCDSGGLGGRRGAFAVLSRHEAAQALIDLSFRSDTLSRWEASFEKEISDSFSSHNQYVCGDAPDTALWTDARKQCFDACEPPRDRRLWTWEARFSEGPDVVDYVALALSPTSHKLLEQQVIDGTRSIPESVRVLVGDTGADGVQFHHAHVRELLAGAK